MTESTSKQMSTDDFVRGYVFQLSPTTFVAHLEIPGQGIEVSPEYPTGTEAYDALMDRAEELGMVQGGALFIPPELQRDFQGEVIKGNPDG